MCVGTNDSGYKRVWAQTCVPNRVDPSMYGHKRVVSVAMRIASELLLNYLNVRLL